jgi:hypothetical protein
MYVPVGFSSNPVTTTPQPTATATPLGGDELVSAPVIVAVAAAVAVVVGAGLAVFLRKRHR